MRFFYFFLVAILLSSCAQSNFEKFETSYKNESLDTIPDYSQLKYWAAHPDKKDPSDSIPADIKFEYNPNQVVDVFFLYPTSYLDPKMPTGWSASLNDVKTNIYTDYSSILYQASVFNEVGRIYAPRYRQAHIASYTPGNAVDTANALAAFELAYQDVKKSFDYYMEHCNNGRPIIIASHSQGSTHAIRLLKEYFDNKPLAKKLVAAYVVGMAIDPSIYSNLQACETPGATGCICAWRTFLEGYEPPFVQKEKFKSIVTNPLTWNNTNTSTSRYANDGSVLYDFNKIKTHVAGAINHDGVLWTKKPRFLGNFLFNSKNYHIADYNFYYMSIRRNVSVRVSNYVGIEKSIAN